MNFATNRKESRNFKTGKKVGWENLAKKNPGTVFQPGQDMLFAARNLLLAVWLDNEAG
jgi:hypothetical protein